MAKNKQASAILLIVVMLFTVIFSSLFIILDTEHDCSIENCQICQTIQACLERFNSTGKTEAQTFSLCMTAVLFELFIFSFVCIREKNTLVSLKIKLSD